MTAQPLHGGIKAALEFGPTVVFVVAYLIFRNDSFLIGGTQYSGFVVVTAAIIPLFIAAIAAQRVLTGTISPIQVATAAMVLLFAGLSVWFNDPVFFKMKPTVIYLALALFLIVGMMRGEYWLKYIMQNMLPMEEKGWKILTRRVLALFLLSAGANELVWRTQSETFWVLFETVAMPIAVIIFFLAQIGLFVDYASLGPSKKRR